MPNVIPVTLPAEAELVPCHYVADVTDGDPAEREYVYFAAPDGRLTIGFWEAQPYTERITSYPGDEFCHVLRGQVTLTSTDGTTHSFGEGSSFTVPAGWAGEWRVDQPFMKYFALSIPAA
ncbi:MAG TPA: cupin domain-containing protein [Streptosporangiaceae bacterium]|jgi:hypothetical protein